MLVKKPRNLSCYDGNKHDWFAWYPVYCWNAGTVWLETVRRQWTDGGHPSACFEYWRKK